VEKDKSGVSMMHIKATAVSWPISSAIAALVMGLMTSQVFAQVLAVGRPAKMLASCEIDLNGDKQADLVEAVETVGGREVIAVIAGDGGC
jgi:hypothetical protein